MLLLPGEAKEILDDLGRAFGLLLDHQQRLPNAGRHFAELGEVVGKAHDRSERIVEVVRDARDQLADSGQLFRLDQLILETLPFGLVAEQQYDPPALPAADGEDGRSINAVPMPERSRGCRARLAQGLTDSGVPVLRHQFMPGATDKRGNRNFEQLGQRAISALEPAARFDDAQGKGHRVQRLLPRTFRIVGQLNDSRAIKCHTGRSGKRFKQSKVGTARVLQAGEQHSKSGSSRVQAHRDQRARPVGVADRFRSTERRLDQPPVLSQASIATHSFELEGFGV